MRRRCVFLFAGLLFPAVLAFAQETASGDARDLQGTWQVVGLEANGAKKAADEIQGMKIVIRGSEIWVVKPTGADPKLKFRVDASRSPKRIDLIVQEGKDKGKVAPGIYEHRNGQLCLCVNIFGDLSYRPREFKTREGDGVALAILEPEKAR